MTNFETYGGATTIRHTGDTESLDLLVCIFFNKELIFGLRLFSEIHRSNGDAKAKVTKRSALLDLLCKMVLKCDLLMSIIIVLAC